MSDPIQRLPINPNRIPTPQEMKIMNTLFGNGEQLPCSGSLKKLFVAGGAFFALSLPFVDSFIKGKISASSMVVLAIKTGVFILILVLVQIMGL